MSIKESDRILFNRVWAFGAKAVKDNRISTLTYVTLNTPTLEEYQNSHGQRMTDLIKVVQLGISQLRDSGELESELAQLPPLPRRASAR
ncbi:hypothetical protein GCM10010520_11460 [Rhizobium viscosum]|uniref:Uncharacterized protein n=1 Tax=Rhizobium viscosum TaxID=1673 RepID=A0ABR9IYK4_RHIVS|nr:hypothetical protein [Rhizobium viscosum]MBE1508307.1 hypothetical protein [Rhizobium viscosum]